MPAAKAGADRVDGSGRPNKTVAGACSQRGASLYQGEDMQRIMLLNPKGGCGKTTIATSLASYYASEGMSTALVDYDSQGSSTRWLDARPVDLEPINGVAAFRTPSGVTRTSPTVIGIALSAGS